jgi:hypothetical protein
MPSLARTAHHVLAAMMAAALAAACGGGAATSPTSDGTATGSSGSTAANPALSAYYITIPLCAEAGGPDCSKLRLGDTELTTTTPARGKLYSCTPANPSAPGSNRARIDWIDFTANSWNLLRKPFLPAGSFTAPPGTATVTETATSRIIAVNNLPKDGKIGDWPMTRYSALTAIDPNPGTPSARNYTFELPLVPAAGLSPSCVSLGAIGATLNGVVLYNAMDARGNDAVAHEIVDAFGGHPAMTDYHYHFVPERLDAAPLADGHSGLVGYIRDGFPLYGYRGTGGVELRNTDLDECHGHSHGALGYHYHATLEYPYTIGCYRGTPR